MYIFCSVTSAQFVGNQAEFPLHLPVRAANVAWEA
jgi:hypothetical protein